MTLEEMKYKYIFTILEKHSFNRTKAAKELGLSIRSVNNHINTMIQMGFKIEKKEYKKRTKYHKDDLTYLFPTNEQRLKHLDEPEFKQFI